MTLNPREHIFTGLVLVCLTVLGFMQFPGHTYLQSDTQIYSPILERFQDSSVFSRELLAVEPHVSFTIYDEVALGLRRVTHLDFQAVLVGQQIFFRALGLLGVFLIATSFGLRTRLALLVTAAYSLGATIAGPAVLTIEYEPVPRGFAVPLLLLAIGLVAHGRMPAAGIAASIAFLYHPPTVLPFWAVYFVLALWPARPAEMARRIWGLAPLFVAVVVLLVLSRVQHGIAEPQDFFGRIPPELEALQRMRANYNWISAWRPAWFAQYLLLWGVSLGAFWRLRDSIADELRAFLLGLPVIGLLSIPVSYVLLERMKWAIIPQLQPARAVLFVVVIASVLASAAACKATRWWERALWFIPVFALPAHTIVHEVVLADLSVPVMRTRVMIVAGLALLGSLAVWSIAKDRRWALVPWAAVIVLPFFLMPGPGGMRNFRQVETRDLDQLASWARTATTKDAMFLFPDAGHSLAPGVFRARALRAIYVDWKGGGQVNFLRNFARTWWERWQQVDEGKLRNPDAARFHALGVDYLVMQSKNRIASRQPVFENRTYAVYATN